MSKKGYFVQFYEGDGEPTVWYVVYENELKKSNDFEPEAVSAYETARKILSIEDATPATVYKGEAVGYREEVEDFKYDAKYYIGFYRSNENAYIIDEFEENGVL